MIELLTPTIKDFTSLLILLPWNLAVIYFISREAYRLMCKFKSHSSAVYFARKIIHILSGGVTVLALPFAFDTPTLPFLASMGLALMTYIPHKTGRLLCWFQVEENISEVYFAVMWGLIVLAAWYINLKVVILPVFFMAVGDGVTGIVRNIIYSYRNKSWYGNIAMALVCIPVGYVYMGFIGALAGAVASIIEHFEFVDDNISIPLSTFTILLFTLKFSAL